jgi:DNA modification methylase
MTKSKNKPRTLHYRMRDMVVCVDCVEGMGRLPANHIDLTVTSPPNDNLRKYKGFSFDFPSVAAELYRVTKPGGVVVWIVKDATIDGSETGTSFKQALRFMELGFLLYDTMIWEKFSPSTPTFNRYYDVFEYMFILSKGKPKTLNLIEDHKNKSAGKRYVGGSIGKEHRTSNGRIKTRKTLGRRFNVWKISSENGRINHPAVFPLKLAEEHIRSWSNAGDLVFDPFLGSGTTTVAAKTLGRSWLGFDCCPEYCDLARERLDF